MRVDTELLRKAENEMAMQIARVDQILAETERIRVYLKRSTSLDEVAYSLKKWENGMEEQRAKQLGLAMALDSISRIYERQERKIAELAESPANRLRVSVVPFRRLIPLRYINMTVRVAGGERR